MDSNTSPAPFRLALGLGLIGALGPSAVDMYLSSLPEIASQFGTSFTQVQMTLTFFLLAMGAGQLIFGPIVDAYGRRMPLMAGLLVFILCSFGAAMAPSLDALIVLRFFQGLGSALTLVVIMSMVRDVSQGVAATTLFALLMTIEGVAPILAPALGGVIDAHYGWRAVMLVLAGMGVVVLVNSWVNLPETLPPAKREPLRLGSACRTYLSILCDGRFLRPTLSVAAVFFFLFAYIGGASLVYQQHYGMSTQGFGLLFGATGVSVMVGAMVASRLISRLGLSKLSYLGVLCMLCGAVLTFFSAINDFGLKGVAGGMAVALFGLGIAESTLMSLVMSSQQKSLGSTAALLGAIQLSVSSCASPLAALVLRNGPIAWTLLLVLCTLVVALLTALSLRGNQTSFSLAAH